MTATHKPWQIIVVGGHTRGIGKTQLVCDIIAALPEARWIAGKITQYGHNFCVKKGKFCDCAPTEHVCAISWEDGSRPQTDSGRFLAAGARKSFWLRTKQGYLAEGIPLLSAALKECEIEDENQPANLILESNTFLDFVNPSLYLMVLDPGKTDFKQSARLLINRASAFVLRQPLGENGDAKIPLPWAQVDPASLLQRPCFLQHEGEALPPELRRRIHTALHDFQGIAV